MDVEKKQAELIEHFTKKIGAVSRDALLENVTLEATSHPSLFAFSEILSAPVIAQLEGTEYTTSINVLRLFAYGTWSNYKGSPGSFPLLVPDQVRKLKQLSVLTLAKTNMVLPYDQLMKELDVSNVRELEDFLINECMHIGIIRGKLDQLHRRFVVQFAVGRDVKPEQLSSMIDTLKSWLNTSEYLLHSIEEKIKWADSMSEVDKKHHEEVEDKVENVKKSVKLADKDTRSCEGFFYPELGRVMDFEEYRVHPKRRRRALYISRGFR